MYRLRKTEYIGDDLWENMVLDKVIVMDEVSGLADKSDEFANFLTVSRKMAWLVSTFFIQCTQQGKTGKW